MNNGEKVIVHIAPCTPSRCGLYETAHDLIIAEKEAGYNAFLYDPRATEEEADKREFKRNTIDCPKCNSKISVGEQNIEAPKAVETGFEDRGLCTVDLDFIKREADFIVSHTGLNDDIKNEVDIPYIHIAHGRPYSSFLLEKTGQTPIYSIYKRIDSEENLKAVVTLWPEYKEYLEVLFQKTEIHVLNAPVNTNFWKPIDTDFNYGGEIGEINVVCADIWRLDKDPYHILNGFIQFAKNHPDAKFHMYGCRNDKAWPVLFACLDERGIKGELKGLVSPNYLVHAYNKADMVITPHKIATRTVREPLSCGTQLVAGQGNRYTSYNADVERPDQYAAQMEKALEHLKNNPEKTVLKNRNVALDNFDSGILQKQMINLIESFV